MMVSMWQIGSFCRKYCHPNRTCVNRHQKASEAEFICLSTEEETANSSGEKVWTTIGDRQHCWMKIRMF